MAIFGVHGVGKPMSRNSPLSLISICATLISGQRMTFTEENYIKAIYFLQTRSQTGDVSANEIAQRLENRPATVTDMLRKLSEKQLIHYEKYKRIHLTEKGKKKALSVIRKHRLWETFLSEKLSFDWDEVHDVA